MEKTPENLLLTENQRKNLKKCESGYDSIDEKLKKLKELASESSINVFGLQEKIKAFKNSLAEFNSNLFIVTTVGMLKAGKSTLVNLFAGTKLASPTGFGKDTTLRPALVIQAKEDKGCIQVWESDGNDSVENALDEVFNSIKGACAQTGKCSKSEYKLDEDNLKLILCEEAGKNNMLSCEPLLVVVKVPKNSDLQPLLSDKIAILDTPGLDSGISEWNQDADNCNRWILRNSDLILFLQSSMAPLNKTASDILKKIKKSDFKVPIWLVHNIMKAKPWQQQEYTEKEIAAQLDSAQKIFGESIGTKNYLTLQANFGQASSYLLQREQIEEEYNNRVFFEESKFSELESKIKENLQDNARKIKVENCCTQCLSDIIKFSKALEDEKEGIEKERAAHTDEKEKNTKTSTNFITYTKETSVTGKLKITSEKIVINNLPEWSYYTNRIGNEVEKKLQGIAKIKAKKLNQSMEDIAKTLTAEIESAIRKVTIHDITLNEAQDGKCANNTTKYLLDTIRDYIKESGTRNELWNKYQFVLGNFQNEVKDLWNFPKCEPEPIKERTAMIFSIVYDANDAEEQMKDALRKALEKHYDACKEKLKELIVEWITKTANDSVEKFRTELEKTVKDLNKTLDEKIKCLASQETILEEIVKKTKEIQENLEAVQK